MCKISFADTLVIVSALSLIASHFVQSYLCFQVCLPYIKQKLDEKFEDLRHALNTNPGSLVSMKNHYRTLFMRVNFKVFFVRYIFPIT